MRIAMFLGCVGAFTVGGCERQSAVELTNASLDQIVGRQVAAVKMRPGEWEASVERLDARTGKGPSSSPRPIPTITRTCLTPRQVERPTEMLDGGLMQAFKNSCRYDRFTVTDGRISSVMRCAMPDGRTIATTTHGTFTATSLAVESESGVGGPTGDGVPAIRIRMTGRRVGACPAGGG